MKIPAPLSPALFASQGNRKPGELPATELKFLVSPEVAWELEKWAAKRLTRDPHADPESGGYQVTSVYLDTPELDIYHRSPGFVGSKYRLRRYGMSPLAHAEHKAKQSGQVWKRRGEITQPAGEWPEAPLPAGLPPWFSQAVEAGRFRPVCAITYQRLAFLGDSPGGPVRVTLDREAFGRMARDCRLNPVLPVNSAVTPSVDLLRGTCVVELKHLGALPWIFREVVTAFGLVNKGPSKYRATVESLGLSAQKK